MREKQWFSNEMRKGSYGAAVMPATERNVGKAGDVGGPELLEVVHPGALDDHHGPLGPSGGVQGMAGRGMGDDRNDGGNWSLCSDAHAPCVSVFRPLFTSRIHTCTRTHTHTLAYMYTTHTRRHPTVYHIVTTLAATSSAAAWTRLVPLHVAVVAGAEERDQLVIVDNLKTRIRGGDLRTRTKKIKNDGR